MKQNNAPNFFERFKHHFSEESAPKEILYLGLFLITAFIVLASLAPKLSEKLGKLSAKKQSQSAQAAGIPAPCGQYGDVDGNGQVDVVDSLLISKYLGNLSTPIVFTDAVKKRADVNGNLQVDSADQLLILRFASGISFTFPVCVDHDTDGFTDAVENYIGTDPYKSCGTNAWPADFNNDKKVTLQDLTSFSAPVARLNTSAGNPNYNRRWDLIPGKGAFPNDINIQDQTSMLGGTTGFPPMFNGQKAFNGPACTITDTPAVSIGLFSESGTLISSSIEVGKSVKISWSAPSAVAPCDAVSSPQLGTWRGQKKISGDESIIVSTAGTYQFTLTCYGAGGKTVTPTKTVTATAPCTGTPVLEVRPTTVERGQNIVLFASGFSNCTSTDVIKFESSKAGVTWDKPLVNCNLAEGTSCSGLFAADWNPGGPYSVRALLDKGGNGSIDAMSNMVNLTVTSPPPPCNGTPVVSLSDTFINPDKTVTATGSGVSNCSLLDTFHFLISSDGSNWVGLSPYCTLSNGSSCSNPGAIIYGLPNYVGGHIYKVKAMLQKSNGQRIDSAPIDLIVKIPNTWGGSKYPTSGDLPSPEVALEIYRASTEETDDPYPIGYPQGPLPTKEFMLNTLNNAASGILGFVASFDSDLINKQRNKFDQRVVDYMKDCGYDVEISERISEDLKLGTDAWLNVFGKKLALDFKRVQSGLGAFAMLFMPRLPNGLFDRSWTANGALRSQGQIDRIADTLNDASKTENSKGFPIKKRVIIPVDGVDTPEKIAGGKKGEFHYEIDRGRMNCQRMREIVTKALEVYKPEIDAGEIGTKDSAILQEAVMQRYGGPGYVPIPANNIIHINSTTQIVNGKVNILKLAEPDKSGGLFSNISLSVPRPSISEITAAAGAGLAAGGTFVIAQGARVATATTIAANFAIAMMPDYNCDNPETKDYVEPCSY